MIHPARQYSFPDLVAGLEAAANDNYINVQECGDLRQYTYSQSCTYDKAWTPFTRMARGLILDHANDNVVATPFPKFFNHGEEPLPIPDLPFEIHNKIDGSLIILFWHNGGWRTATKGSFNSEQAKWAMEWLRNLKPTEHSPGLSNLAPGTTYLFEAVYPENRIVVTYDFSGLVLLGGYHADGREFNLIDEIDAASALGCRTAGRRFYSSISELLALMPALPASQEGFVVRFNNGYRLKFKGDEYCRIHRLISNVTPLAIWESMKAGDDLEAIRRELPEEFWADFDGIRDALTARVEALVQGAKDRVDTYVDWTDKELGLKLPTIHPDIRPLVFPLRKHGIDRARQMAIKSVRPTGNRLDGYKPSSGMHKVLEAA